MEYSQIHSDAFMQTMYVTKGKLFSLEIGLKVVLNIYICHLYGENCTFKYIDCIAIFTKEKQYPM